MPDAPLCDAHCHPTDDPASLKKIPSMQTANLTLMSTRLDDIDLVYQTAESYPEKVIPAFGYHPWFSHLVYTTPTPPKSAYEHYSEVLTPQPTEEFVNQELPFPVPFDEHLNKIREYLLDFPNALVGETGMDKAFRLPIKNGPQQQSGEKTLSPYRVSMAHQQEIFTKQLKLANELNRPTSIHGVQCHNAIFECVLKTPHPPAICLHSYTGSPEFLSSNWFNKKNNKKLPKVFVSSSSLINITTQEKANKLIPNIPQNRILSESDYHAAGDLMDQYVLESVETIRQSLNLDNRTITTIIAQNYSDYIQP